MAAHRDIFAERHTAPVNYNIDLMLQELHCDSIDTLIDEIIPANIRLKEPLNLPPALTERAYTEHIHEIMGKNQLFTTYIGYGWYDTITPAVIMRNVFENPVWYTSYTPYQSEISQGRLEALLNFQTVVSELTALPLANASLLDEATAAAEAAAMMFALRNKEQIADKVNKLFVDEHVFSQTLAVLNTRCLPQGIEIETGNFAKFKPTAAYFGAILQYPNAVGQVNDYREFVSNAHLSNIKVAVAADILSLCVLTPPGEWGADIAFGSTQRLGIPLFYGGPSAAYFATQEVYKRSMPGRIVGISKDSHGRPALRMALQTREQHIKREKATSNICTAQALLATMASFYAIYHGPAGLRGIAKRIHAKARYLSNEIIKWGYKQQNTLFFDTLWIKLPKQVSLEMLQDLALSKQVNLNYLSTTEVGVSIDETTTIEDLNLLVRIFGSAAGEAALLTEEVVPCGDIPDILWRASSFMQQEIFKKYHTETELMRYIKRLERKDISLAHSMIPLGSCTMKLNAASTLLPLSSPYAWNIHPLAPKSQTEGYNLILESTSQYLSEITGMAGTSLQPNSGAAGEYTGLMVIRSYHENKGEGERNIVLIPASAHGTNPASAVQAGYQVVVTACDEKGNIDVADFREKAKQNKKNLAACMITYPSTHGIFEVEIKKLCEITHRYGGQVYMDGANMNAQVGLTNPGTIGADVCHLNLHKTFAIPHGGGGPGVGPICVAEHLVPFLPHHPLTDGSLLNTVSAAPFGSAGVITITYGYIRMMGCEGLVSATKMAIFNANYMAAKLKNTYGIVYSDKKGRVGHELILDCRSFKDRCGITETDIAKRLMDFGYHAPTLSFPVHGTLMIEPTESESKEELDRFIEAMETIYAEITAIEQGNASRSDNLLINAPHAQYELTADNWDHTYSRTQAAYPLPWVEQNKFWINVSRVDNGYGDRNLIAKIEK